MDGFKEVSPAQFAKVPRPHSAADNFNGRVRAPEGPARSYREPLSHGDDGPGAAWQPDTNGQGRPVTPFASGYFKPIVAL